MTRSSRALAVGFCVAFGGLAGPATSALASPSECVSHQRAGCFRSIGAAVDHASSGQLITVAPGRYHEQVAISGKRVTLRGAGRRTVVDAAGKRHGFLVSGAATRGTVIKGFEVVHAKLEGILVENTARILIRRNRVERNDRGLITSPSGDATCPGALPFDQDDCGEAIHLLGVAWSRVVRNLVNRNVGGILLTDETGATHDNLVAHNRVTDNKRDCGITLPSHPSGMGPTGPLPGHGVFDNVVSHNVSTGNGGAGVGIFTPTPGTAAYGNVVIGNRLANNGLPGVALHSHAPGQNLNGNAIIGNTISGNAADDDADTGLPTGIVIFNDASSHALPIVGTTVAWNTISGEGIDVWVGRGATSLALHTNNLLGAGKVGVANAGTGSVDATENFWGCPAGPGGAGCSSVSGSVTFDPWLTRRGPRFAG
jgi:Right handed beta helix region